MSDPAQGRQLSGVRQEVRVESGFGYGVIGADLHVFADRGPLYLLQEHHVAPTPDSAWLLAQPSRLLNARHAVVDFTGRDRELAELAGWRDDAAPLAARWLHAPGGQGKTRLAYEFARRTGAAGWKVVTAVHGPGSIVSQPRSGEEAPGGWSEDLRLGDAAGVLLLVDYADRWPRSDLAWLFSNVLLHQPVPTRLLLVARSLGPWPSMLAELDRQQADTSDQALPAISASPGERERMFTVARDAFAAHYGISQTAASAPPDPESGLTLALHVAALVAVDAAATGRECPTGNARLSAYLLDREREHWAKLYESSAAGADFQTPPKVMARSVFAAALTGAVPYPEGKRLLGQLDLEVHPDRVLTDHATCYPATGPRPGSVLEPLYPDRLAEDFLALTLPGHDLGGHPGDPWAATATATLLTATDDDETPHYLPRAITFLAAAAQRWPHVGTGYLYPLVADEPRRAVSAGGAALASLAGLPTIGTDLLEAIESELPEGRDTDLDAGIAAIVSRLADERLASGLEPADRVRLQWNLSVRLSNAGLHEQALPPAVDAVALARDLAVTDAAAYESDLAGSLMNLGDALSQAGRREESLEATTEAIEIHRRLARRDPATFTSALAASLHNRSIALAALGRREDAVDAAEEAVRMRRGLGDDDPDLAGSLDNLGVRLYSVGRQDEGLTLVEEAIATNRELAAINPGAFATDLARTLSNYSLLLWKAERQDEALAAADEAITIRRRLATLNPAAFGVDLADTLINQGNALSEAGRPDQALEATTEAIDIYRGQEKDHGAQVTANLALALANLGRQLANVGERAAALDAAEQAVTIRRELAAQRPAAFEAELAAALDSLGNRLSAVGQARDALAAAQEATEIRRRLAAGNPAAFDLDLATSLTNQAPLLWALGRPQEAVALAEEAVELRRTLGDRGAGDLAAALTNLSLMFSELGRGDEALTLATEAVTRYRSLTASSPAPLANALLNLGIILAGLGRSDEGLAATEEAVLIRRELAADRPEAAEPDLAASLTNLSADLLELGRRDEALAALTEAVEIQRRQPATPGLGASLTNLAVLLAAEGRGDEALDVTAELVQTYETLAEDLPGVYEGDLQRAQAMHAELTAMLGRRPAPRRRRWPGFRRR